jgi:cytochrome c oxidase subunit III
MPGAITDEIEILHDAGHGGGGDVPAGGDDDSGSGRSGPRVPERAYYTAVQLALAGIIMFFMALTSSFLVRKGLGNDWISFELPRVIWVNTVVLLASSTTLEIARSHLRRVGDFGAMDGFRRWWGLTTALGLVFLAGQFLAWRELAAQGVFLATNPSSSFFYLLTALHAVHLIGGVLVLLYVAFRNWRRSQITLSAAAGLAAIYWHFLDGLWLFLLALLYLGR